jgi:tRNA threonylcarbamoyl adenosine modification protein YeaZ
MNENLLNSLNKLLTKNNLTFKDIDYYYVIVGPGSFTGIRIGVASLLGLTTGLNKQLEGVSSLDAAALSLYKKQMEIAVKLRGNEFVLKRYNFSDNLFSDYIFSPKEDLSVDTILLYEDKPEVDLSKAILHPMFNFFKRDYLPFYMRKSEAELYFDSKSTNR